MRCNIHGCPVGALRLAKHLQKGFANNVLGLKLNLCQSNHFLNGALYVMERGAHTELFHTWSEMCGLETELSVIHFYLSKCSQKILEI